MGEVVFFISLIRTNETDASMPFWSELTYGTFSTAAGNTEVVVMVTGSLEAHGLHLPLGTDSILPTYLAERVAQKTKALVLPTIPFGDSWAFNDFHGTVSIHGSALVDFYVSVMKGVFQHGFRYIVALNGHGGNVSALQQAAKVATKKGERAVIIVNWWRDLAKQARKLVQETPMGHAAEDETSEVLFVRPDLVDMKKAEAHRVVTEFTIVSGRYRSSLYPSGMEGDPRKATGEKGQLIMEQAEEDLLKLINGLEKGELPIKNG
ncbi:MAG: creatininase family protein [Candidatus Thorarchaeota archaeon]|nr:MAG: creatininase family protein [Candidatus Thorarchaeota archaeon]RLI60097.1 MAG: creatininase family protein [Candidatus Thorarchaeota archaeon]